jgi:hypothetical protein
MKATLFSILMTLFLLTAISTFAGNRLNAEWEELFNGENLDGWEILNGQHKYEVVDGMIVGTTIVGQPNGFLSTKQTYSNFVLELDFLVDETMNSGVMIRGLSKKDYKDGRVHSYQVEIDPSARAWTGGIYDEARRGWIYDLRHNEAARNAFKQGEWNTLHIEAIGNSIRTWLNGTPCANLVDDMTSEGFIGLQVHSNKTGGAQVRWKNIRILDLGSTDEFPQKIKGHSPDWTYPTK